METDYYISTKELRKNLIFEIIKSVGLPYTPFWQKIFSPLFWLPTDRFAHIGSNFDAIVAKSGFNKAMKNLQSFFVKDVEVYGNENIPKKGPLLVLSNHPGTYDAVVLSAQIPRDDIKIVASDIPFIENLKTAKRHFLFATRDTYKRMIVIKKSISYLENGGVIVIFPSGHIDPEPAFLPQAMNELETWSRAIEIFVKKVPETTVQVSLVSNVLSEKYYKNPLTRIRKHRRDRQRIGEFLQVIDQLVFRKKFRKIPKVSFAEPFKLKDISKEEDVNVLMPYIISKAKELMALHIQN